LDRRVRKWCIVRGFKSRRKRWVRNVARVVEMRSAYKILVAKPEGMGPLGRPRHRLENTVIIDLREIRREFVGWIYLAQDRDQWRNVVNMVMNIRVPLKMS